MFNTLPIFRLIYDSRSGEVPKGLTGSHEFGAGSRKKVCGGDFLLPRDPCSNPIPRYCPPLYRHSVRGLTWYGKPVLSSCPQLWVPLIKRLVAARFPRVFKRLDFSAGSSYARYRSSPLSIILRMCVRSSRLSMDTGTSCISALKSSTVLTRTLTELVTILHPR